MRSRFAPGLASALAALFTNAAMIAQPISWAGDVEPRKPVEVSVPTNDITLKADLYRPHSAQAPTPAVLLLHGWPSRDPLAAAGDLHLPVLLVHGSKDKRVPTEQSVSLYRRLRELDRPVRLELLPDTGHYIGAVLRPELATSFFRDIPRGENRSATESE